MSSSRDCSGGTRVSGAEGAAHRALVVLEDGEVLEDVVLDGADVGRAHPVLGGGAHEALRAVLVLHPAHVPAQLAVDVAQHHQEVREVALRREGG